jgi:lipoprotein NlpI
VIAELGSGDTAAAAKDAAAALQLTPQDPYYVLWLHVARILAGQRDADEFTTNANRIDRAKWHAAIVALFLGGTSLDEVRNAAGSVEQPSARIGRLCEADFVIGIYHLENGDTASARLRLQSAVDHCPHGFFEYSAAKFVLARFDGPPGPRP